MMVFLALKQEAIPNILRIFVVFRVLFWLTYIINMAVVFLKAMCVHFYQREGRSIKRIRNTILNNPGMFFAYNNGIAATAYKVKVEYGKKGPYITEITSLQIVNGGQTTVSLAMAAINDKNKVNGLRDIYVPMKLSVVTPQKAMELIPNIAKYANKQNKVSDATSFPTMLFTYAWKICHGDVRTGSYGKSVWNTLVL